MVVAIAHEGIAILQKRLVPEAILFSTGQELDQVMVEFEACVSCHVAVKTSADFGDTYLCYKKITAIILYWHVGMQELFSHALVLVNQVLLATHTHIGIV